MRLICKWPHVFVDKESKKAVKCERIEAADALLAKATTDSTQKEKSVVNIAFSEFKQHGSEMRERCKIFNQKLLY